MLSSAARIPLPLATIAWATFSSSCFDMVFRPSF
jgi:hypothetical protein